MSFIGKVEKGTVYAPGWFLVNGGEDCIRVTAQFDDTAEYVTTAESGAKYVPMGTVYPDETSPKGIVYEDVDVSTGAMPGSLVTKGTVYTDRVKFKGDKATPKAALEKIGFTFVDTVPKPERPY